MSNRPPSPPTPTIATPTADTGSDDRLLVTTAQLSARLESSLGYCPEEGVLEDLLVELDRDDYVEWVTVTQTGDYVWDVTDSPDRIAEAVAEAAVDRLTSWLAGDTDTDTEAAD